MSMSGRPPRRRLVPLVLVGLVAGVGVGGSATVSSENATATRPYLVLGLERTGVDELGRIVAEHGGQLEPVNTAIGLGAARLTQAQAARLAESGLVAGVAPDRVIGRAAGTSGVAGRLEPTGATSGGATAMAGLPRPVVNDPLESRQWDMTMLRTSAAQRVSTGRGVLVGVMDTGIDASHPDLAGRINLKLSRNFTVDNPLVDGPCEAEPDRSCTDPVDVDENEHGTHVAGTIAAGRNGRGIVGVAPEATLVNLRTGQDSGFFFLSPTVNALTYAADNGIDVVNMSYFIDPWLFNCPANAADSPAQQKEQRTIIEATTRALKYATARGVTIVAAAGNEGVNLDAATVDSVSPNFPITQFRRRTIDNSCVVLPAEGPGVITVSSIGPSKAKANYSNWGQASIDVAAPGGFTGDSGGNPRDGGVTNQILAPMPKAIALRSGAIDAKTGQSSLSRIVAQCPTGPSSCAYYQYLEGTSMAAPHVAGVAALVISRYGHKDARGGLTMNPAAVLAKLTRSADKVACPVRPASKAACTGTATRNSWYGQGIVNALAAVTGKG